MAFTTVTVSHTFENADGTNATGSVAFKLTKRMTNGTTTVMPTTISVNLVNGAFSQALLATDDTATVPTDAQWLVMVRVNGARQEEWQFALPHADAPTVDLYALLPNQEQVR